MILSTSKASKASFVRAYSTDMQDMVDQMKIAGHLDSDQQVEDIRNCKLFQQYNVNEINIMEPKKPASPGFVMISSWVSKWIGGHEALNKVSADDGKASLDESGNLCQTEFDASRILNPTPFHTERKKCGLYCC